MIENKFNIKDNVLEANYIGNVPVSEVIDYIRATKNNIQYPRVLKIISDTRNALFNFSISDLDKIVEENNQSLENYDAIIDAIIVDNPKNTVLTVLYQMLSKTKKYKFEIFATKKAALEWLDKWKT
jgi:hypothetical protein